MAYVYQVKHRETGEFYIGSKYAMGATPENTTGYFGTSKGKSARCSRYKYLVSNEKHLLDKVILGMFDTKQDALKYEIEMHNKLFNDPLCLNGAKQTSNKFSATFIGKEHPFFGKVHLDETRQKMRLAKLGKKRGSHSLEHIEKIRLAQVGRKFTEEHKAKLSLAKLGKPRGKDPRVNCPHCFKEISARTKSVYHFDNCKYKEVTCPQ
jgi:hypothetical protein